MTEHQRPSRPGGRPPRGTVDPARAATFEAVRMVDAEGAYANLVLPQILRRQGVRGRDAAFATELTYGVLRMRGAYDKVLASVVDRSLTQLDPLVLEILRMGTHQLLGMRVPDHAAVSATVGLARAEVGTGASGYVNAVLRKISGRSLESWLDEVAPAPAPGASVDEVEEALAARYSHPAWIVRALRQALVARGRLASEITELLAVDNTAASVSLLARPGLADVAELVRQGLQPGRWSRYGYSLASGAPGDIAQLRDSRVRVQDEGSQLVTLAMTDVPVDTGGPEVWLDLCAGPGGKSSLLSALAAQRGARGVSVEVSEHRTRLVEQAVAPARDAWEVRQADGRTVGESEPESYDRVLVDAPCTGLGALRRRPEARWRRTPADLATLAPLQRDLLASAVRACAPGGVVAYVTCSPHIAETGVVVEDIVKLGARGRLPVTEQVDARPWLRGAAGDTVPDTGEGPGAQLWPHRHGTDGMFLALLRRI